MNLVSDRNSHADWIAQVLHILDKEFGADPSIASPASEALNQGFGPVAQWFADALVPLIGTNAALRGETRIAALASDHITEQGIDQELLEQLVTAQQRYCFGFDAYFDAMQQSALDFAADNVEMITEHFGAAESYAEYYAESSCDVMQQIAARSLDRVMCSRMKEAFRNVDVAAWTACFPGSFTRGILASYAAAHGRMSPVDLANTLKRKLGTAFANYDQTDRIGRNNGSKQS